MGEIDQRVLRKEATAPDVRVPTRMLWWAGKIALRLWLSPGMMRLMPDGA